MTERDYHDVANIFPLMTTAEFQELCEDIREHGLQLPIVLIDEKILDGRNRYMACKRVGVEPEFVQYTGNTPIEYAISANLKRRHLTTGQLVNIAEKAAQVFKLEAARKQRERRAKSGQWGKSSEQSTVVDHSLPRSERGENSKIDSKPGKSSERAGKAFGISGKSVERYHKLKETASTEVLAAVDSGEMTLNAAIEITKGKGKPPASREKLLKDLNSAVSKVVRTINDLGCKTGQGKKAYEAVDALCGVIEGWK